MNVEEIDKRLRKTIDVADDDLFSTIVAMKKETIESEDETSANLLWCYETIYNIQKSYLIVYKHLKKAKVANDELDENGYDSEKSREYETAWNELERCEIQIGALEENFCIPEASLQDYGINIVLEDTKRLQGLFPYAQMASAIKATDTATSDIPVVSSIEIIKGREAERCLFILSTDLAPYLFREKTEDNKTSHLLYVALTRSLDHLTILVMKEVEETYTREKIVGFFQSVVKQ